ncbi:M protein trans-acting positive regulator [Enterococcus faecalis]|uniref:helix-turn-helix domain-containing protein n=1 Tax=Enterococcus TaxID=1350 RepID=UPI001A107E83|nr:M protein trans-acting positive regulator [Enterococcus faecalis]EGO7798435.1 M protein trans-acting positive regulator [Enterococcus faecalis]EIX6391890.1 helix-turn-helix domain-containing protein [Enterococcus faecalis]HAP3588337.1 M protein trans-acting positive regulator [Enterococcus faecalis]HBI2013606.1 helix-turn-helix domain-containing protein [Enterococcus faecalis]
MIPDYLRKELSVLFFIINKEQTTASEISHELAITKRAVSETLSTINNHFEEYQNLKDFIVIKKSGSVQIQSTFRTKALDSAYNLKLQLLKKNTLFNYTILLLTRTSLDQKEVIEELFISTSYLNKLTHTLNGFFSPFNFTIAIVQGQYSLVGNEMNIRLFSYLFLQDSFQDIEWPFNNISLESIRENVPEEILIDSHKRSNTKNRSLYILYAILQNRVKNQNYVIQPTNKLIQALFIMIQENFDVALIFQQNRFSSLEKDVKKTEIDYFNFLSRIFISDIIPKKDKINLGRKFSKENHPYCTLSIEILRASSVLINDHTSKNDYFLFHYYITLFNTFYFLVGDTLDSFTSLFFPPLSFHSHVQNEYMSTIKTNLASLTISENHKKFLSNLLYTLYTSEMKSEVTIYLQLSKDFTASFFIENQLSNLFNSEQIMITDNYSLSDVIITDTLERTASNKKIFYLDSIDNENKWKELLFLIQNTYLDKQNTQKERIYL